MKVIDKRTEAESIDFIDVGYGTPFEYKKDFYIKTNDSLVIDDNFTNAVNLKTGILWKFDDKDKVILVDASIVIN